MASLSRINCRGARLNQREAVVAAPVKRLRSIAMTKLACIVGLVALMPFARRLRNGIAITMIGGLAGAHRVQ